MSDSAKVALYRAEFDEQIQKILEIADELDARSPLELHTKADLLHIAAALRGEAAFQDERAASAAA